ncbi:hypothetical protein EWM64_g8806, partial [Hericium alpestre]
MLGSLFFFTLDELELLDCGRTIQGLGGKGIASLSLIILSDLVTLQEHGTFTGLIAIAWAAASGIGPIIDYVPVYFQACKNASPTRSGIDVFSVAFMMVPLSFITGILVTKTNHYRPQVWIGWVLLMIGTGLLSKVEADTNIGKAVGYQIWGITIGGSILQNQLQTCLPPDYTTRFLQGTEIAYASIPEISNLPQPLKDE